MMRELFYHVIGKWKIIAIMISIILSLTVTSLISFRLYSQFKDEIINQNLLLMNSIAGSAARSLDWHLKESLEQALALTGSNPSISGFFHGQTLPEKKGGGLDETYLSGIGIKDLAALMVLTPDGALINTYPRGAATENLHFLDMTENPRLKKISGPVVSAVSGSPEKKFLISITVPFMKGGSPAGMLKWIIRPDRVYGNHLRGGIYKDLTVWLLDGKGRIISHPDGRYLGMDFLQIQRDNVPAPDGSGREDLLDDLMNGNRGTGYIRFSDNIRGESHLIAYAPLQAGDMHWSIAVTKDYRLISDPIERFARNFLTITIIFLLFIALFGYFYFRSRKISAVLRTEELNSEKLRETSSALQVSESRLKSTFRNASIATTVVGLDGRFQEVNDAMCSLVGYSEQELLSMSFMDITYRDDMEENTHLINRLMKGAGESFRMEKRYVHRSGRIIWIDIYVSIIRDEKSDPLYFIVQIQDITARKEAEEKTRASLREKEIMLQEIHHRVKNNMQIVSSLLSLQADIIDNDLLKKIITTSQNRIRSMALVHEMLYGSESFSEINFSAYIQAIVKELQETYEVPGKAIAVSLQSENTVLGIHLAIPCALIVNELVSNSLKHAFPDRSEGEIRIGFSRDEDDYLLTVEDNGIGFRHNRDYVEGGSLGLYLVIELCSQIGGEITIEESGGTRFSLTFGKIKKPARPQEYGYPDSGGADRKKKILIVEDERITAVHLRKNLENAGYGITGIASSGSEALKSILAEKPDLIIMDIFLEGERTGIEIVRDINKYFFIPVIYCTANSDPYIRQKAEETSPAGYVSKPFDRKKFMELIGETLLNSRDGGMKKMEQ